VCVCVCATSSSTQLFGTAHSSKSANSYFCSGVSHDLLLTARDARRVPAGHAPSLSRTSVSCEGTPPHVELFVTRERVWFEPWTRTELRVFIALCGSAVPLSFSLVCCELTLSYRPLQCLGRTTDGRTWGVGVSGGSSWSTRIWTISHQGCTISSMPKPSVSA
jgi:hypothetical protein